MFEFFLGYLIGREDKGISRSVCFLLMAFLIVVMIVALFFGGMKLFENDTGEQVDHIGIGTVGTGVFFDLSKPQGALKCQIKMKIQMTLLMRSLSLQCIFCSRSQCIFRYCL